MTQIKINYQYEITLLLLKKEMHGIEDKKCGRILYSYGAGDCSFDGERAY